MTPVRLGLIGFGRWAKNYVSAAVQSGEARVVEVNRSHIIGSDAESAFFLINFFGRDHLEGMISRVDAVVVASQPEQSAELCERVLAAGKPVLVEKPAGLTIADAVRITNAEQRSSAFVLVGHQHLFSEGLDILHTIGSDFPLFARWHGPGPKRHFSGLWDYGPHAVSAILAARRNNNPMWMPDRVEHLQHAEGNYTIKLHCGQLVDRVHVNSDYYKKFATLSTQKMGPMDEQVLYDGYALAELPLTRQVRAFARAVRAGGSDDWRFGAGWAVDVAKVLTGA